MKKRRTASPKRKPAPKKKPGRGGARDGAGRPRDKLPPGVIKRLGPPPSTPNELRTWNAKLLAEVQWLSIKGEIGTELAATLRANAGSIDRALPPPGLAIPTTISKTTQRRRDGPRADGRCRG
jgi:hypothetical protein